MLQLGLCFLKQQGYGCTFITSRFLMAILMLNPKGHGCASIALFFFSQMMFFFFSFFALNNESQIESSYITLIS